MANERRKKSSKEKSKALSKESSSPTPKLSVKEHYRGMPEFVQEAIAPYQKVVVNLVDEAAALKFFKLVGQPFTIKTRSIWYPEVQEDKYADKRYSDSKPKKKK